MMSRFDNSWFAVSYLSEKEYSDLLSVEYEAPNTPNNPELKTDDDVNY